MTTVQGRRRKATITMIAASIVGAIAVPVLSIVGVRAIVDATGGKSATVDSLPRMTFPSTPTGLLLTTDDANRLSSATVFVLAPPANGAEAGVGGSVITVPVNADVGFTDSTRISLQGVFAEEGADGTRRAVESLLTLSIDVMTVAGPALTEAILKPVAPITARLVTPVPAEGISPAIQPGVVTLSAAEAARVLTTAPEGGSETTRRPNLEAVWQAVANAVGAGLPASVPTAAPPATFDEFAGLLFAGRTNARGLPTIPFTDQQNPARIDAEQLDRAESVLVFASLAPAKMTVPADGPRYRIEAPAGSEREVKRAINLIFYATGNVVSVDLTGDVLDASTIIAYEPQSAAQMAEAKELFGTVIYEQPKTRLAGVDIVLKLGSEFLKAPAT